MRLNDWLHQATTTLKAADIPTARLDALVLLSDSLGNNKAWILSHPEFEIDASVIQNLYNQLARRVTHEPLAYIRGISEFYGRDFIVTSDTLQPRAETETMIDLLKKLNLKNPIIADIGTGSGCLAITAQLEFPNARVYAIEINNAALNVAQLNAKKLHAGIEFYQGNLIKPLLKLDPMPSILLCNLPYIPSDHIINKAAMHEPKISLFGGEDGLDLYREMFAQIDKFSLQPRHILTETLPTQHNDLANIAKHYSYRLINTMDFIQLFDHSQG